METLTYHINIEASAEVIWRVLWEQESYRQWIRPFDEGSYYEGRVEKEGSRMRFIASSGVELYSVVEKTLPNEYILFRHQGMLDKEGEEVPLGESGLEWTDAFESYRLTPAASAIRLEIFVTVLDIHIDFMNTQFPKALRIVKELAEE